MNPGEERSALEFLDALVEDNAESRRTARRERLRLELARFMKKAREEAGLTQRDVAASLGVTQAWVSKLENANYDHKLESVLTYFDALGAEMRLSVDVCAKSYEIWGNPSFVSWDAVIGTVRSEDILSCRLAPLATRSMFESVPQQWAVQSSEGDDLLSEARGAKSRPTTHEEPVTFFGPGPVPGGAETFAGEAEGSCSLRNRESGYSESVM